MWPRHPNLNWTRDGADWPNREHSRFVAAAGLRWHVQVLGRGPVLLGLHGTGAATHTWRGLAPRLAAHYTLVLPDLPGHGFTEAPPPRRLALAPMAADVAALLRALDLQPAFALGHSAGAAVLAQMTLDGLIAPRALAALNGALLPLPGMAGLVFPPMARLLALNPLVPWMFAWRATDRAAVERLIRSTGSQLDAAGVEYYARVVRDPEHAGAVLQMMARWDLRPLVARLPRLEVPLLLLVGTQDRTVPPAQSRQVAAKVPGARVVALEKLGHLAHEEAPERVAEVLLGFAGRCGV